MNSNKIICITSRKAPTEPFEIQRRNVGPKDVQIKIEYCGVCHTDLHFVNNDWNMTEYPVVPGHEIVGRVTELGSEVTKFSRGDLAAIGCMIIPVVASLAKKEWNNIVSTGSPRPTIVLLKTVEGELLEDILK